MTVRDYYDLHGENILCDNLGQKILWIVSHSKGLTLVDTNSSLQELGYRDDSNEEIESIVLPLLSIWNIDKSKLSHPVAANDPSLIVCQRCGHSWFKRTANKPGVCPDCGSARWETKRTGREPGRKPYREK